MSSQTKYDRQLLLLGEKRNAVLELSEVQRYGADSYGDPDYVSIYGLRPAEWHAKGIRLLGRTAVECTRDRLGDAIGRDVSAIARTAAADGLVVDPFAGSGNTLYWILRHLPGAKGLAFETDPGVFRLTAKNLSILGLPLEVANTDYELGLKQMSVPDDKLLVAFIAPPWGRALSPESGLDLRLNEPPVGAIVDALALAFPRCRLLCAVQVHERLVQASLSDLASRFDWSALEIYGLNRDGENHGILLGTKRWAPRA
jgi:hypothetical protein